jgi:hypothetical protein
MKNLLKKDPSEFTTEDVERLIVAYTKMLEHKKSSDKKVAELQGKLNHQKQLHENRMRKMKEKLNNGN